MSSERGGYRCLCGHGWGYHAEYDEELDRYVVGACDHYSGCGCPMFRGPSKETELPNPENVEAD